MKELKSKKNTSAPSSVISDEEYAEMVENDKNRKDGKKLLPRFTVTDLHMKTLIPSLKEEKPIKITKKEKNEG